MFRQVALILFILAFAGCTKTDFQLRFRNNLGKDLLSISMNEVASEPVAAGTTSEYKHLLPGTYKLKGNTSTGFFTAQVTLEGDGRQLFTVTIDADNKVKLNRDE